MVEGTGGGRHRLIEALIRALARAGQQADDRELAEMLWLSRCLSAPATEAPPAIPAPEPEEFAAATPTPISSSEIEKEEQRPRRRPDGDTTPVYSVSLTGAASKPLAGRKIRVPGAAALPAALEIARALRPFSRRFPSRQRFVFDEEATVRHAADGGPLTPMLRPAMERWFEIALVVEETPAMAVWRQTITELQRLLAGQGAFRDVRLFQFRSTDTTIGIVSRSGIRRDVPQLIDSDGRRLILITSDCVSPGWRNGAMAKILAKWGARMPVVIVQMLPETLWRHTALGSASISLRAVLPGVPNKHLAVARPRWDQEPLDDSLPMPVVTLDPDSVSAWAGMVMGTGTSFPGVLLGSSASRELWEEASPSMEAKKLPDARERIQLFRDLASREAFQFAVYLAAVPLTLPVMRLVQRTMFRDYRQVHLAEVFLGGLLERLTPADVRCDPSEVEYDFYEGVREVLTKSIRRSEASKVLEAISKYVEDHTGKPFDFEALILDSGGEEQVPAFALPFARVGAEFIRRLGRPPRLVGREISVHRRSNQPTPFRDRFPNGTAGPAMVWLPGGPFTMGDDQFGRDNEKPAHPVTLSPFGIGQYPVTFEEYDRFCEATSRKKPDDRDWGRGYRPVIHVSWDDAQAYCQWLSQQTSQNYRLLTEAQWEYACRASSETKYCFGDDERQLEDYAWYWNNAGGKTHPVGEKQGNAWGLHDLHGNVWEWVQDWYGAYSKESQQNPSGPESGSIRVVRGGSWDCGAESCRSACRDGGDPGDRGNDLGFRLARLGPLSSYPFPLPPEPELEWPEEPVPGLRDPLADGSPGPAMVGLPGGTFRMGQDDSPYEDEKPAHEVEVGGFSIGQYPVTFEDYDRFCEAIGREKPSDWEWGRAARPVIDVSWEDAVAYCAWLSQQTGARYRLPTEAEWEYACRASSETKYCFGDDERQLEDYAWYSNNAERKTHPVGEKQANAWGLYDVHGNVLEWVQDWYGPYSKAPQRNPSGPESGSIRVFRSGSWDDDAGNCRSTFRDRYDPGARRDYLGFRLARTGPWPSDMLTLARQRAVEPSVRAGSGVERKPAYKAYEGFRDRLKDHSEAPEMVYLPGGTFQMGDSQGKGSETERPVHEVTLDAFAMGRYPLTVGEFRRFVDATGYRTEAEWGSGAPMLVGKPMLIGEEWHIKKAEANWRNAYFPQEDAHPVVCINWNDAAAYCEWLSKQTGGRYRLPTEAEWEYACRASSEAAYCFGDDKWQLEDYAWYSKNARRKTHPVGQKRANAWGLHDLHGHVWEWVRDWYGAYSKEPQRNPSGPRSGSARVIRGGSRINGAGNCRSAVRDGRDPGDRLNDLGFRLARRV